MPLNKPLLQAAILQILEDFKNTEEISGEAAAQQFAEKLTDAIDAFVRTGTVVTTGSATTQTGTIT
jgi:flagellar basal body-associated protein FliL